MNVQGGNSVARSLGSAGLRYSHPLCCSRDPWRAKRRAARAANHWRAATGSDRPVEGPWARRALLGRLEAVLFLTQEPLNSRKLAHLAGLADGTQARTLVRKLNELYDGGGWAFRVVEIAGGFRLMSRPKFAPWLRRLHQNKVEVRLSAPAMETLAVVAYRQPVLRADIEAIRGVQCGEILRQLMERELVRIAGRSEELGRPFLYGTTKRFLQVFGLKHLDDLPWPERLRQPEPAAENQAAENRDSDDSAATSNTTTTQQESNVKIETPLQHTPEDAGLVDAIPPTPVAPSVVASPQLQDEDELEDDELEDDELGDDELEDDDFDDDFDEDYEDFEDEEEEDDDDLEEDEDEEDDEEDEDEDDEEEDEDEDEEDEDDDLEEDEWEEVEDDEEEDEEWEEEDEDWGDDDEDEWEYEEDDEEEE
jgi:segregation and condensation protein B